MKTLAERVAALTPQQRELLLRTRERQRGVQSESSLPARTGPGPWPACADQAALWYFQQVDADAVPYNIGNAQRVFGPINPPLLEQAYASLVQRQEMLRACYPVVDGVPYVAVAEQRDLPIIWVDLRNEPAATREHAAQQAAARLINRPFDLVKGPIMRFVVLRLAAEEHIMIPVMHHSITDAVSYNIFFRELIAYYWGLVRGRPAQLPPITRHYIDYGLWRNQWLQSEAFQSQLAWWQAALAGAPTIAEIPADYKRPKVFTYRGSRVFFTLDQRRTQALRALNRRAGTTSLMSLLAASYALFYRFAGLEDMLIAVPASHREHREMTHVIGYFLNYVPFRGRVHAGMTFNQLLAATKENVLGGLQHKRVPFSAIVEAVKPERDLRYMPLTQLGFVYVSAAGLNTEAAKLHDEADAPPFRIEGYYADREISPMDMQLIFMEGSDEVTCFLEYASDIYKHETMEYLTRAFLHLFDQLLAAPTAAVDRLPLDKALHGARSLARLAPDYGDTAHENLSAPFWRQALTTPDTTAVMDGERSLTYAALAAQATAVARALSARGIGRETPVAVSMHNSAAAVAALFGVLAAGAAFVPIGPELPPQRRRAIADNVRPALVLVDGDSAGFDWGDLPICNAAALAPDESYVSPQAAMSQQLAYILHTSGSTGRPKGVLGKHGSLVHRLRWLAARCPAAPGELFALTANPDINEWLMEIGQALFQGGTLVIAPQTVRKDPALLVGFLAEHRLRRIQMVPSLLRLLVQRPTLGAELADLQIMVVHGEALPVDVAAAARAALPACTLVNNYGLTEATGACAYVVDEVAALPGPVPIGQSLGGHDILLLDGAMNPVPPGAVGELYLAGPAVARGYFNAPAETAARFVPDPNGDGTRLFRTGDLARFDPQQGFIQLGRADNQLKVRGNRVEPGEIEAVLRRAPGVADAAVYALNGDLVAAVQGPETLDANDLREFLRPRLPEFMVPTLWVVVPALPRTHSNKIDQQRLLDLARSRQPSTRQWVAPRTETERRLAAVWADVLGCAAPGIDDDFYELGGHSLRAAEIVARLHRDGGRAVPLALLLQTRNIRRLAEMVERLGDWHLSDSAGGPTLLGAVGTQNLFVLPPMLGFAMIYRPLAERLPGVSLYGFDFVDTSEPESVVADHIERQQPHGPLSLMGYSAGGNLAFETAQELERRGRTVKHVILLDSIYRQGPPPSENDLQARRAAFLADLQDQLREDPVMGEYADEPYLLALIQKTPGAFYHHHYRRCDRGTVKAPLVFLRCGEDDAARAGARAAWRAATGDFRELRGHGRHDGMLQGEALAANAALLLEVLR